MAVHTNGRTYVAIIGILMAVVLAIGGALAGGGRTVKAFRTDLDDHKQLPGHPVIIERVEGIKRQLDRLEVGQQDLGEKLDAVIDRLP